MDLRRLRPVSLLVALCNVRCAVRAAHGSAAAQDSRPAALEARSSATPANVVADDARATSIASPADPPRQAPSAPRPLPFLSHALRRCYVDRLADSPYLRDWVAAGGLARPRHDGDPLPSPELTLPAYGPLPDTAGYAEARASLEQTLRAAPQQSHVLDCTLRVARAGGASEAGSVPYTVYLPADYLANPTRPRAVLLLAPGGRGDRTRWFLSPDTRGTYERGTGGLEVRARVDAWASAHRDAPTPLVVAIDGPSGRWIDGRAELLGRDLPSHIVQTFLSAQREEDTPIGVQAISLGAAWIVRVMQQNPSRFATVGLMGMFCDETGLLPERDLGSPAERDAFYQALAARTRAGALAFRMNIGRRDRLYDCNKRWYFDLQRAGVFTPQRDPTYDHCTRAGAAPDTGHCRAHWPGFTALPQLGHHYAAVVPIFGEDLAWQLDELTARTPARDASALTQGRSPPDRAARPRGR